MCIRDRDTTVYPLEDAELLRLLDNADVTLDVFNSAPLYAKAMAAGDVYKRQMKGNAIL